jgi:hypothetical protein
MGSMMASSLTVNGDLTVTGSKFVANVQTVAVRDNILLLNSGQTGTGVSVPDRPRLERADGVQYRSRLP